MSSQFEKAYRVTSSGILDYKFWNGVFQNVDQRLVGIEDKKASFEDAEKLLLQIGLKRINETIQPAAEKIQRISELGFMIASSEESLKPEDGKQLSITLIQGDQSDDFAPSPFVAMVRRSTPDAYAIGRLLHYDREAARVDVEIVSVHGIIGPHNDWDIAALAGSVMATVDALQESRAIRNAVKDDKNAVGKDKVAVNALLTQANGARNDAETAKAGAVKLYDDFSATWFGERNSAPVTAKIGAMYLDTSVLPAIVKVRTAEGWVGAAIAANTVYTKNEADKKFFLKTGGTLTGAMTINIPDEQCSFANIAVPNGLVSGGGVAFVPSLGAGGARTEVRYLGGGGVYISIAAIGTVAEFRASGDAAFKNEIICGGNNVTLCNNGNIRGPLWETGYLNNHIENRAAAIADDRRNWCVTATRFAGYSEGGFLLGNSTITGNPIPSGYVVTGIWKSTINWMVFAFRQPQVFIQNRGWVPLGGW